jgi:AraC-like DNA-binding protein
VTIPATRENDAVKQHDEMPVLAGRAGEYREYRPSAALERHFLCTWSNAMPSDHVGPVAVVPDGCVDLIWIEGRLMVAGPDEAVAVTTLAPGRTATGIRFRPGAATNWLGLPMSEIVGLRIDLGTLWGTQARDLADRIGAVATTAERIRAFDAGLSRLAPAMSSPAPEMELVFRLLGRTPPESGLRVIRDRLDVSERSLRRRCHAAFGYGPKTLDRILRFQRFMRLARRPGERRLSLLAHEAGYADQAHLTREVRRLSGLAPSMILRQA